MAHPSDHTDRGGARFYLDGQVAVVTGGTGALGAAIAGGLAASGARVAVLSRRGAAVSAAVAALEEGGGDALGLVADVLAPEQLAGAAEQIMGRWGRIDVLVNAAGGNLAAATVPEGGSFFELDPAEIAAVVQLNLMGTLLPIQAFGPAMAEGGEGSVVNLSSAAGARPLSRVVGYSAAKAAVENASRWLADHVARRFGPGLRVNAVAPGFFLAEQNRELLTDGEGGLTDRGRRIVEMTPMGRLGRPDDLVGPVLWLASSASRFVTGAVVPVDGGFGAVSGL